ncbi:MAG TPA: metal ABC transporter substrate-binding protein, partial [Nitrospiria bacterium]|nr:metal ABC transporter substrate-binding protein [Nitrospiria bacterium]
RSHNPIVLAESAGYVDASEGVDIIPYTADEIQQTPYFFLNIVVGGVHKIGNHHYYIEPANGGIIAKNIADKLSEVDKAHADYYQANYEAFQKKLDGKLKEWDKMMEPYKGTPIVMYHRSWNYLARRHDLPIVGYLEPRETFQLDSRHTASVIRQMKKYKSKVILEATYYHSDQTEKIAKDAGAVLVTLPASISHDRGIDDYFQLFDQIYDKLTAALKQAKG